MAEIFGVAAGALSIASLFSNCVDCFEYIQLGRQLEPDFARSQLKLDICKTRLSRWGEAVSIAEALPASLPNEVKVRDILEDIARLYGRIQKTSKQYLANSSRPDEVAGSLVENDLDLVPLRLHHHLVAVNRTRQKHAGLLKKAAWALYDSKHLARLIEEMTELVESLEILFPPAVPAAYRRLAQTEIEDIEDDGSLGLLQEAATGVDTVLSEAAGKKMLHFCGKNYAKEVRTSDLGSAQVGNEVDVELSASSRIVDKTSNAADFVYASGSSSSQIGNKYVIRNG